MSIFNDSVAINDEMDFNSKNFNLSKVTKRICEDSSTSKIESKVENLNQLKTQVNGKIVVTLEKDSSLFVNLSQVISMYEREFLEFPQKIAEIQNLVKEAKQYPKPCFDEIPTSPKIKDSEIIKQPHTIIDAPILYECLVQQHRISESIDLVIKTRKALSSNAKSGNYVPLKKIEDWVQKASNSIHRDTVSRLKSTEFNSELYQNEFKYLIKLGFTDESIKLFLKYSTQQIDEQINLIQNDGKLLQYIREVTDTLATEIIDCVHVFMEIFKKKYYNNIVGWATKMVEDYIPFEHPEIFIGNYNVVKDSVIIMQHSLSKLEELGISTLNVFDSLPDHFRTLLTHAAQHRIKEIADSIADDDWDINNEGIRYIDPKDFPLSNSCIYFRSHVFQFLQEMKSLYLPAMFYDAAAQLKKLIASYFKGCFILISNVTPSVEHFCVIITQLTAVKLLIFPELVDHFKQITGYPFPNGQKVIDEFEESICIVEDMLVHTFIVMWADVLPPEKIQWGEIGHLESHFQGAIDVMTQFLDMLNIPDPIYIDTINKLVEKTLYVVDRTAGFIDDPKSMDSFDFHWEYFTQVVAPLLTEASYKKLKYGIQDISSKVCMDQVIDENDRETPEAISLAVQECLKANGYL